MKSNTKDVTIYYELVSIIERDSDAIYDILDVLISNLNDKQLDIMEDLIVNQYGEDYGVNVYNWIQISFLNVILNVYVCFICLY